MGDVQSAHRGGDATAAEGESGEVQDEQETGDQPLKNNGQISEINGKEDSSIAEVIGHCEEQIAAEAILSPDEDVSETEPLKEEEHVEMSEKESPNEADANEDVPLEVIEMDAKQNDINESFRKFFSNIGLKLTVKRGSGDVETDETNKEEANRPEEVEDTTKETTSANPEQNTDVNMAQETYDNDSTTCPTLTDITSEDVLEKATETKEEVESNNADAALPVGEDAQQDGTPEEEPQSPSTPEEEEVVSPIKRFFTTGIFSGLRKKKMPAEDETADKELEDLGKKEVIETTEQTVQDQQDNEEISVGVEAAAVETEHKANELKADVSTTDPLTIIVTEPEMMSSQEKDIVQASPLKRLLSGSGLKKLSKKQRDRKSSDAKLSDSGEHVSDQLQSSTESAENQKEEGCAQSSAEAAEEEEGAWASFKKLMTPKKLRKRSSLTHEETKITGLVEEPKPSEGGQMSDHSTEEGKKLKDSSVSWESVLCGSGRRRSRKTSDSEEEKPQVVNDINKQDAKHGAELGLDSSNEVDESLAYSPKQAGSPSEGDGGSTWKSLKRLVTPKRKAKDEDESKDNVQSDSEVTQDESFSIKKLLPGRKKRKSAEKQDQVSSDEADKDVASGDEDSDTPAVVPLSEFDTVEIHIQTQVDIESHIPKEAEHELQQDLLDQMPEPVLPSDSLQTEAKKIQDKDALGNQASTTPSANEESDDLTESISKPQLSDIPEEATPASVTEEAARDDTIAEDLIEITSEAITAPEPLDITLADETEMISAVSQLSSESSKTSGNTTPVPAEYVEKETDTLLHQVVETISIGQQEVPVFSDDLRSDRVVVSVSHQTLDSFVQEGPTILEIDNVLDATNINTDLNVEELATINELTAIAQIESISEVNDSTDIVSEVHTEEFNTAEIALDDVYVVDVTHQEESLKELESIDESHHLVECLSEVNVAASTDNLPVGDNIVPDEVFLVETEPLKKDSQDAAATEANENKEEALEQEVQSLTGKEDQIMHNITDQIQVEDKDQPQVEDKESPELDQEEDSIQPFEKDVLSEDVSAAETYEVNEETVPQSKVNVEPEKEEELETDAAKPEHVPEALEAVPESTLDSEEGGDQSPTEKVKPEDVPPAETVTDEPKKTEECLAEVSDEPGNKELQADVVKPVQEPEEFEAFQAPTLDSEEGSVQSLEKEVISEDVIGEPKEETKPPTAELEQVDTSQTKHVQEQEELETFQAPMSNSEEGSVQLLEKEVISEDVPKAETVSEESGKDSEPPIKADLEPVNASKTVAEPEELQAVQAPTSDAAESTVKSSEKEEESSLLPLEKEVISEDIPAVETVTDEPKKETEVEPEDKLPVEATNTDHVREAEVLEAFQAQTLDSAEGSVQSKDVISEDAPEAEIGTGEPKEETIPPIKVTFEAVNASKTEHVQEPEVLEAVQAPTPDSEAGSVQSFEKEVISEDIPEGETVTDEPQEETIPPPEASLEPVDASKTVGEPEVLEPVQAPTSDSAEGSVQSFEKEVISVDIPEAETVTDEPKEEAIPPTEAKLEPMDAPKNDHVQEPEVLQTVQVPTSDSEPGSVQSPEKEDISEDVPKAETVTDESKEETIPPPEANLEPGDDSKTEHVQEPEVLHVVQAPTLKAGSLLSLEKEVIPEDIPAVETVTDEPKEEIPPTVANAEPVDLKTEKVQEPKVLEAAQASTLDSAEGSVQSLVKEVISENVPAVETVTDEPKKETEVGPEDKLPVEATNTEHVQEPEVLKAVQASTLDSADGSVQSPEKAVISKDVPAVETVIVQAAKTKHVQEPDVLKAVQAPTDSVKGSVQSLAKEVISKDVSKAETVTDEPKEEAIPCTEANLEPVDASKTNNVQELEVLQAKEVISEDISAAETVTGEPKQDTEVEPEEKLPVEAAKTQHIQEPDTIPSDVKDIVTETKSDEGTSMYVHVVPEGIDGGSAQELKKQILLEEVPKPDIDEVIASVTNETESEVKAQLDPFLEKAEDQKTESTHQNGEVEKEDRIPEVVDKLQTLTAVCVSSVNEEASNVQVLEKIAFTEEPAAPCVDTAAATNEPKHEVQLSPVQARVETERESELPGTETKTAAVEHAVVAQVVICKDVSVAIPDVFVEKTSDISEPLTGKVTSEIEFKEEPETATPLVKDGVAEKVEEGSTVVMMHVPPVGIQVKVVDVDVKSAETIQDTEVEVGLTEAKDVIDVCHETVTKVDNFSATPEIEEAIINKEFKVTIQEVIEHKKENLPETVPESVVEQEGMKQPDAVTKVSGMLESGVEDQNAMEDRSELLRERQEAGPSVVSDVSATEQQVSEDLVQNVPRSSDASIHVFKDNLAETKAEGEKSEEVKSNQIIHKETQIVQSPIVTPSHTGLVARQNTGMISSNMESPSSVSIEFKLNIQLMRASAPVSPPPAPDMSEVGVQAVEEVEPVNQIQRDKSQKQTEITEGVQATEITEPAVASDSTERAVIMTQPVLLDISIQAMEPVEPVEQIKSTEKATSSVQAAETTQPGRQTEKRGVSLSPPDISCDQVEQPVKQKEEENEQDVWMDAEEDIYTQEETEVTLHEVEKYLEPRSESGQEEKVGPEPESEMAPNSKTEEEERHRERTAETREMESEGEDFAVALEHPEYETVSVTTMEWDFSIANRLDNQRGSV